MFRTLAALVFALPCYASDEVVAIRLEVAEQHVLSLEENPTTGFMWKADADSEEVKITSSYESDGDAVGQGGQRTFIFTAESPGQAAVTLEYRRGDTVIETVSLAFVISGEDDEEQEAEEIIEGDYTDAPNDPFELNEAEIEGGVLSLNVSYGGGAELHEFFLFWDGEIVDGLAALYLRHNANGDSAEAYLTEVLAYDISDIDAETIRIHTSTTKIDIELDD